MEIIPCIAILYNSTILQELAFQKSWSYFIFELMVYFHGEQLKSCWDFSKVLVVTLFIVKSPGGRLPILSAYYFICNNTCNITGNNNCHYFKKVTNLAIANPP